MLIFKCSIATNKQKPTRNHHSTTSQVGRITNASPQNARPRLTARTVQPHPARRHRHRHGRAVAQRRRCAAVRAAGRALHQRTRVQRIVDRRPMEDRHNGVVGFVQRQAVSEVQPVHGRDGGRVQTGAAHRDATLGGDGGRYLGGARLQMVRHRLRQRLRLLLLLVREHLVGKVVGGSGGGGDAIDAGQPAAGGERCERHNVEIRNRLEQVTNNCMSQIRGFCELSDNRRLLLSNSLTIESVNSIRYALILACFLVATMC